MAVNQCYNLQQVKHSDNFTDNNWYNALGLGETSEWIHVHIVVHICGPNMYIVLIYMCLYVTHVRLQSLFLYCSPLPRQRVARAL